jgi:hypothetical protein
MNHAAASTVKVVTEGLALDHGETETRPIPAPSATNANEKAAATNAPAKTAAHDTPEALSSAVSAALTADNGARAEMVACVIFSSLARTRTIKHGLSPDLFVLMEDLGGVGQSTRRDFSVVEKRDQDNNRDWNPKKPKQNSTAQSTLLNAASAHFVSRR